MQSKRKVTCVALTGSNNRETPLTVSDEEQELVRNCHRGDSAAFQTLFERHGDMMQRIAARMSPDAQLRKDIFQEAARIVLLRFETFKGRSSLATWLYRVTVNTALKALRREKRYAGSCDPEQVAGPDYGREDAERTHAVNLMLRELSRLPKRQRACASLFYFAERSVAEIAAALSIRQGAVKTALFKARKNIALSLRRKGVISWD